MIIINNQIKILPIVDLLKKQELNQMHELIEEFIIENKKHAVINKKKKLVFPVTGFAKQYHDQLGDYLNQHFFKKHNYQAKLTAGYFSKFPSTHFWLKIGSNIILDITVNQFLHKLENKRHSHQLHYFLSNNPLNKIYNLYHEIKTV